MAAPGAAGTPRGRGWTRLRRRPPVGRAARAVRGGAGAAPARPRLGSRSLCASPPPTARRADPGPRPPRRAPSPAPAAPASLRDPPGSPGPQLLQSAPPPPSRRRAPPLPSIPPLPGARSSSRRPLPSPRPCPRPAALTQRPQRRARRCDASRRALWALSPGAFAHDAHGLEMLPSVQETLRSHRVPGAGRWTGNSCVPPERRTPSVGVGTEALPLVTVSAPAVK